MKIICIGENFRSKNKNENTFNQCLENLFVYLKPESALLSETHSDIYIPDFTSNLTCNIQLAVKIAKQGKNIAEKFAYRYYQQLTVGVELEATDLLEEYKAKGKPWDLAKSFDKSAVVGKFMDKENYSLENIGFSLLLNDEKTQKANTKEMIYNIDKIISYVSQFLTLKTGDLIFTGSVTRSRKLKIGDKLNAYLEDEKVLSSKIL